VFVGVLVTVGVKVDVGVNVCVGVKVNVGRDAAIVAVPVLTPKRHCVITNIDIIKKAIIFCDAKAFDR